MVTITFFRIFLILSGTFSEYRGVPSLGKNPEDFFDHQRFIFYPEITPRKILDFFPEFTGWD